MTRLLLRSSMFLAILVVVTYAIGLRGSSPNWQPGPPMLQARTGATAVMLDHGHVLVTGGEGAAGPVATTELFNSSEFFASTSMAFARSRHAAVKLNDGRVLVVGGASIGGFTSTAEIFDPATEAWGAAGTLVSPRAGHTATLLRDGRVLIVGGETSAGAATAVVEVFDPSTSVFGSVGTLAAARRGHAAALMADGRVLIAGGSDGTQTLSSTELIDPADWTISAGPTLLTPRSGLTASALLDGRVLLAGGSDGTHDLASAETYDPRAVSTVAVEASMLVSRRDHIALTLPRNGSVLFIGGVSGPAPTASTELFVPWREQFVPAGTTALPRLGAVAMVSMAGPSVYVGGGGSAQGEQLEFPTVRPDKSDYRPGEVVTITGSGWEPGEIVTLTLNEVPETHAARTFKVIADEHGEIVNAEYSPEEHDIGVLYRLTAAGSQSPFEAQAVFTDHVSYLAILSPTQSAPFTLTNPSSVGTVIEYSTPLYNTCNGGAYYSTTYVTLRLLNQGGATVTQGTWGVASGFQRYNLSLGVPAGLAAGWYHLQMSVQVTDLHVTSSFWGGQSCEWQTSSATTTQFNAVNVVSRQNTVLNVAPITATYGGLATFQATLRTLTGVPVVSRTVNFTRLGSFVGSASTDSSGVATLSNVSLTGIAANTYANGVGASFNGDSSYFGSNASNTLTVNRANTATIVASNVNPSTYGQSVTLSATVSTIAPGGGIPTGGVQFFADGNPLGSAGLSPAGVATLTTSALTAGTRAITASYLGFPNNQNYNPSGSGTLSQVVRKVVPSFAWGPLAAISYGTPLGSAQLSATANVPGTFGYTPVAGTVLPAGQHQLTATFTPADTVNYYSLPFAMLNTAGSASPFVGGIVQRGSYPAPQGYTQRYDATGNIAAVANGALPAVTRDDGFGVDIHNPSNLNDGFYGNGSSWIPGTTGESWIKIDLGQLREVGRVKLGRDRIPGGYDDRDIGHFRIAVAGSDDVYASGNDANDASEYQQVFSSADHAYTEVVNGTQTLEAKFPPVMARFVKVFVTKSPSSVHPPAIDEVEVFNRDPLTSPSANLTVNAVGTQTTAVASPSPSTFGQQVDFTATVRTTDGAPATAGGVVFKQGTNVVAGPIALNANGQAGFNTTGWPVGTYTFAVEYSGSTDYNPSAGSVTFTVNKASSLTSVASSQSPSGFGESLTFTATVAAVPPAWGTPTGSVQFQVNGVNVGGAVPLLGGIATLTHSTTPVGANTVTALYGGDGTFNGSSGSVGQQVNLVPPTFSGGFPTVPGACICTPLLMNTDVTGTQYWWVKAAGGDLTITAIAHAVNNVDPETVVARVYDPSDALVATLSPSYPAGSPNGFEDAKSATLAGASGIYRVEVTTPGAVSTQPHYRLKFDGAVAAGTSSPSAPSFEHQGSTWYFAVGGSETLNVRAFVTGTPATASTIGYTLVDPLGGTTSASVTATTAGDGFITGGAIPGVWTLRIDSASDHYGLDKTSGADRGIYLDWRSAGEGKLTVNAVSPASGGALFTGGVTFTVKNSAGAVVGGGPSATGTLTVPKLPVGTYTVTVSGVAPGWTASQTVFTVNVYCDKAAVVEVVIADVTPPVIDPLPDLVLDGTSVAGAVVTFTATADDPGRGPVPVACIAPSGTTFGFGTTTVVCTAVDEAGNAAEARFTVTVNQLDTATSLVSSLNPSTYGDAVTFTATVQPEYGSVVPTGSITFTTGTTTLATVPVAGGSASYTTSSLAAGGHAIKATYSGDPLYIGSEGSVTQTVNRAILTVQAANESRTYGDPNPSFSATISGFVLGETMATSGVTGSPSLTTTATAASNVGAYPITVGIGTLTAQNYGFSFVDGTLTINVRPIAVAADPQTKTYGDADPALSYQVTGTLAAGDAFSGSLTRAAGENVGSYAITQGDLALSSNYSLTFTGSTLTINVRPIAVTADPQTKTYGDADPALSYQVTGTLAAGDAFNGSLTRAAGENVGGYAITQGDLALSSNYNLTFTGSTLTINVRPIAVTADPQTKTYGDADPALSYQVTGTLAAGDAFTGSLTRAAGENVGSYAITQGDLALSSNYNLTFTGSTLTIDARPIAVAADLQTKIYGTSDPALTYQVTSGSLAFGDAFTGALTRVEGESVNSYAITQGDLALSGNYELTYVGADFVITKATLTVTAEDKSRAYGQNNPAFTAAFTGFAFSDTAATSLTGSPALTTSANPSSAVGVYTISAAAGSLGSDNYDFTFVDGTLTVGRRSTTTAVAFVPNPADEGASSTATFTVTDTIVGAEVDVTPSGTLALSASGPIGPVTACTLAPTTTNGVATCSVTVQAIDNDSATVTAAFAQEAVHFASGGSGVLSITNLAPVITSVSGPTTPLVYGGTAAVAVNFTDAGASDTHVCTFTWDDGQTSSVTVTGTGSGSCSATHPYATAGVYAVAVEVKDKDNATDTDVFQYVVVYDPSGGFVTGGGFINSPAGAMPSNPALTGRANFGFVSKYLPGANVPSGQTEFQFKVGNLNFHSTVYEWLVVAGAKAQFKGSGRINNAGDYAFMLTATDGQISGGGGLDKFRIKIWDKVTGGVIYDNTPGGSDDVDSANPQAISGGSIVIHKNGPGN